MPNSKRKREKISYDGKASSLKRKDLQQIAHQNNIHNRPASTPWETSKAIRRSKRIAAGKTHANWARNNAKQQPKANVSNLNTNV